MSLSPHLEVWGLYLFYYEKIRTNRFAAYTFLFKEILYGEI